MTQVQVRGLAATDGVPISSLDDQESPWDSRTRKKHANRQNKQAELGGNSEREMRSYRVTVLRTPPQNSVLYAKSQSDTRRRD